MNIKAIIMAAGLAVSGAVTGLAATAQAQLIGGEISVDGDHWRDDVNILAGEITIRGRVDGDVQGVGGDVEIDADVQGDVNVAGGDVTISGTVGGDVESAGGEMTVSAIVAGRVEIAGGDVLFSGQAGESLRLAGGHVVFASGAVAGDDSEFAGGHVEIHGEVRGDLRIHGEEVEVGPTARIDGVLEVRGPREPTISPDAVVAGGVDYEYESFHWGWGRYGNLDFDELDFRGPARLFGGAFVASAFLLGLLAALIAPKGVARIARTFRRRPVLSGLIGFLAFALSPIVIGTLFVTLLITVIGIPLAFLMMLLVFPVMFLAYAFGGVAIGDMIFNRGGDKSLGLGMRALSLFAVLVAVAAIGVVPGLGLLVGLLLLCIGLGAWIMSFGREEPPAAAATAAEG